jgi:hypothetical protein
VVSSIAAGLVGLLAGSLIFTAVLLGKKVLRRG